MKVNSNNRDISFKGILNNKFLKSTLEFAANEGTLFAATTTLVLSSTVRPLVILAAPNTNKKDKQVACAKSLTSTLNGYLITFLLSKPLSRSISKIDEKPSKFLNKKTISNLQEYSKPLTESKSYQMATQLFKLGLGAFIAAPKAILTAFLTPDVLKLIEDKDKNSKKNNSTVQFKGKPSLSKSIGNFINNQKLQDFVKKHKDSNFPMHIIATTDTITTATFVQQTYKSKKFKEENKIPLIYNSIISTVLSIISTYFIDSLTKNSANKFIEKYKLANKNDPNLAKQLEGIKIAKPMLIAGCIYYLFIPLIATYFSDKVKLLDNFIQPKTSSHLE